MSENWKPHPMFGDGPRICADLERQNETLRLTVGEQVFEIDPESEDDTAVFQAALLFAADQAGSSDA